MVKEFYLLQRFVSLKFHKFEALIYFHAQYEYGSELEEYYNNKICKPDMIQISQESAYTTGLLEQYLQHLSV